MDLKLTEKEHGKLALYIGQYEQGEKRMAEIREHTDKQIASLIARGAEVKEVLQAVWEASYMRRQLKDPGLAQIDIPPILDDDGKQLVTLDAKNHTASWGDEAGEENNENT